MASTPVDIRKAATPGVGVPDVFRSFRSDMDRLFDRFASDFRVPSFGRLFESLPAPSFAAPMTMPTPAIDVTEDAEAFRLTAELPGMSESDIELSVRDGMLTLKGEKKQESERTEGDVHLSERAYGAFTRSFAMPDNVDPEKISAAFAKGVLTVTMPKTPGALNGPKKIEVKPG